MYLYIFYFSLIDSLFLIGVLHNKPSLISIFLFFSLSSSLISLPLDLNRHCEKEHQKEWETESGKEIKEQ